MKTNELIGASLDWAVAKCEGHDAHHYKGVVRTTMHQRLGPECSYSTDWSHGGPIIEREGITVQTDPTDAIPDAWSAYFRDCMFNEDGTDCFRNGPTPLIAAMRCYVASKLGAEVDVPEELK